jgi:hypothetical protein
MIRFVGVAVALGIFMTPALAYENFIPLGTGYSTAIDSIPEFSSRRDALNVQADIFETENYRRMREQRAYDSMFSRFFSDADFKGGNTALDY